MQTSLTEITTTEATTSTTGTHDTHLEDFSLSVNQAPEPLSWSVCSWENTSTCGEREREILWLPQEQNFKTEECTILNKEIDGKHLISDLTTSAKDLISMFDAD